MQDEPQQNSAGFVQLTVFFSTCNQYMVYFTKSKHRSGEMNP